MNIVDVIKKMELGKVVEDIPLSNYTTYKVGGNALAIVYPKDTKKLIELLKLCRENEVKFKVLGFGSNTLFSDKNYEGIIIKLDEFNEVNWFNNNVTVGAGFSLMRLSLMSVRKGLSGLEFATGIPGTIGGAVYMNAGAYKSDMGYIVKKVKVLTPDYRVISMTNSELEFHYRTSFFQKNPDYICLEATLKLKPGNKDEMNAIVKDRRERRVSSQPLNYPSAGSVFRNPEGTSAGKLIDDLGLKGLCKGGAKVSDKHANFIINIGGAKAKDIKELITFVHDTVLENYDIDLKVEQEFVNWE